MKNKLSSGLYLNLPTSEYHSDDAIGSSTLKTLVTKTPAHLKGAVRKESAAFDIGSAFHTLVLEPSKESTIICGGDDRRGNKWKEAKAEADFSGNIILTADEYDKVFSMRDSLMKNEDAVRLLTGRAVAEASLFARDKQTDIRCKIRPDLFNYDLNCMVDLKTALTASPEGFSRAIADYGYHIQQAYYQRIWNGYFLDKQSDEFFFIVIEKEPPYLSSVYTLNAMTVMEGHNLVKIGMDIYRKCKASNLWRGYEVGVHQISIPRYSFKTINFDEKPVIGEA
jgi:PDDEXK-like domain of unknown function (DUF3799)